MAEDVVAQEGQEQPQVQIIVDERDLRTLYSNSYRIHTALEEVVIDIGFNMVNPNQQQGGQQQVLYKVSDRVVMSYATAKRLAGSLSQLIKRYEQQFGEILIPGQQQQRR